MQTTTGFFLLMLFGYSKSLSNTRCFLDYDGRSSLCFTRADPLVALSWSSAMEWCKIIGGTLPTPDYQSTLYGNVLGYFGLHTETTWLGANFTYDLDNWYWTNGSRFIGTFEDSSMPGKAYAYIVRNGTDVKFVAAAATDNSYYICQYYYSDLSCASYYQDSYWTSEKCYVKNRWWASWDSYRSSCGSYSLAIIDNLDDFSRWLEDSQTYWIGLRCSWWTWHNAVTGNSYEVMENRFGSVNDLYNGTTAQCLASNRDSNGYVSWTNQDCSSDLPFICQYNVDATTSNPATFVPTFTPTPDDPTTAYEITTTPSNPVTFVPTSTLTPIIQTTASEIITTPSNPVTFVPTFTPTPISKTFAPTSTPTSIPSAMTSSSVFTASTPLPVFTTIPTNSPTTASVSSSTQTATTSSLRNTNSESKPEIFGMSMEFFVGLGGGLLLANTVWLALITVYACKKPGGTKIFPE